MLDSHSYQSFRVGLSCWWCCRNEGLHSSATSGTFLVEDGPYYFCMLEILLGRLSKSLYNQVILHFKYSVQPLKHSNFLFKNIFVNFSPYYLQALKKISKFVRTNILPGAIAEVGLLCCACVHSNPEEAVVSLIEPILSSVISSLKGTPVTGFGGSGISDPSVSAKVFNSVNGFIICLYVFSRDLLGKLIFFSGKTHNFPSS